MAMQGTVKFFNGEGGYGFIKPDDGGRDVFVHITAVERAGLKALNEGQRISFDVEPDKNGKGPKAVNLAVTGCGRVLGRSDSAAKAAVGADTHCVPATMDHLPRASWRSC